MKGLRNVGVSVVFSLVAVAASAQTFDTLVNFDATNGADPGYASLAQGVDGNYYGTTTSGGAHSGGTVFTISAAGVLTTLYSFCSQIDSQGYCTDGLSPSAGLVLGTDGNFFGTTTNGGANSFGRWNSNGTIFKITPSGTLTTLYSFCAEANCADGQYPYAGLVQGTDGNFYGTTSQGGASTACNSGNDIGCGTVFRITPTGHLTTLHSFAATDGAYPYGSLIQSTNGQYYGTTSSGTIYKITSSGVLTTLYSFQDTQGPYSGLLQAIDGNFYGTTYTGGANRFGSIFRITESGVLTTLYSFCNPWPTCLDGSWPAAGLVQGTDGNFYGTTTNYGTGGEGTIFTVTTDGSLTTLHNFDGSDGQKPLGVLLQATDGTFYGTTSTYGPFYDGTLFALATNLSPFVKTLPAAAKIGAEVGILGANLTGTTSVSFNSIPAQFRVKSPTLILARVPKGAATGYVALTTPSGTLTSNLPFHVIP